MTDDAGNPGPPSNAASSGGSNAAPTPGATPEPSSPSPPTSPSAPSPASSPPSTSAPSSPSPAPPPNAPASFGLRPRPAATHASKRAWILDRLTVFVLTYRVTVLTVLVFAAVVSAIWASRTIYVDADTDSLIGETQPFMADYRAFKREFGDLEYLIVAVDAQPPGATSPRHAEAKAAVIALVDELRRIPDLTQVHGFIDPDEQMRLAPWSREMKEGDLDGLVKASDAFEPLLARRPAGEVLANAEAQLDRLLPGSAAAVRGADAPRDEAPSAPAPPLERSAQERLGAAAIFTLRAIAAGAPEDDAGFALAQKPARRFLSNPDPPHELGRFLFVTILPKKAHDTLAVIEEPLEHIRAAIARVQASVPDVEIGLTGKPVLQADEMSTTNRDMTVATIVGFILVAILFMIVFRGVRRPLLANLAFAVGAALTFGAAALLVGRLNLLSMVFMLVLVGVGVDYGIHMIARYTEGLRRMTRRGAIRHMMRTAVPSNATGAIVAGGTFLIALLTPFQGLRELGLIAGVGIILCMATMALMLPVLLDMVDRGSRHGASFIHGRRVTEERPIMAPQHVAIVVIGLAGAIVLAVVGPRLVRFESNLLELQADSVDAVKWEKRILEADASETWFGVAIAPRLADIPPLVERAAQEPAIGAVRSVLDLVAMPTAERTALLEELGNATDVAPSASAPSGSVPAAAAATERPADARSGAADRPANGDEGPPLTAADVRRVAEKVDRLALLAAIAAPGEATTMRALAARLRILAAGLDPAKHDDAMISARRLAVADALATTARWLAQMGIGARGTLRDALPDAVRAEFVSPGGLFAVRLHPKEDVWEFEPMAEFVAAMRRVDPHVTGVPITQFESMILLERSFLILGVVAAVFVAIVLFVDLRNVYETLACLIVLGAALAWTLGAMAILGVSFNLANFFGIPITLGLGSDACIHIVHRAREGLASGFGSTRRAVVITALTTVIGFGGLLFAAHRGLQSLGILMVISTLSMLGATVLLLPALLRILARLRSST